jgi:hypothetical protein
MPIADWSQLFQFASWLMWILMTITDAVLLRNNSCIPSFSFRLRGDDDAASLLNDDAQLCYCSIAAFIQDQAVFLKPLSQIKCSESVREHPSLYSIKLSLPSPLSPKPYACEYCKYLYCIIYYAAPPPPALHIKGCDYKEAKAHSLMLVMLIYVQYEYIAAYSLIELKGGR